MDDFSKAEMAIFSSGTMLELPLKDQADRPVFFYDRTKFDWEK